jgi:catechol 2,3-dioxygenase-like lactoylglutathione lyase family enzyme
MKVSRLCWLGTRTEAFDETTAFFRDVLGLSLGYEEPGFAMFALPAADRDYVEVFSAARSDLAASYTTGPVVGLLVDDVVGAREELAAAGVELLDETQSPETMDGYRWFHFRGPDGNVYAIVEGSSSVTS